jgi:hypothetical protein
MSSCLFQLNKLALLFFLDTFTLAYYMPDRPGALPGWLQPVFKHLKMPKYFFKFAWAGIEPGISCFSFIFTLSGPGKLT